MGKSKRNREKKKEKQDSGNSQKLPVLSKLAAGEIEDRTWAAAAISNIVQDEEGAKQLMSSDVVSALLLAIKDSSNKLVLESIGALRNVLSVVGEDACQECLEKQGITSILSLMPKLVTELEKFAAKEFPDPKKPEEHYDCFMMAEHILSCLWSLAEYSEQAVQYFTTPTMMGFLFNLLELDGCPDSLCRIAMQFMNTISEENSEFQKIFSSNQEYTMKLFNILQSQSNIEIKLLSGSILHNLKQDNDQLYEHLLSAILQVLQYDLSAMIPKLDVAGQAIDLAASKIPANAQVQHIGDLELTKPENKNTELLTKVLAEIRTIQLALEILTNIYSEEIPEVDEEMDTDQEHMEIVEETDGLDYLGSMLNEKGLLLKIINFTLDKIPELNHDSCKELNSEIQNLYTKHFSCLNNIFLNGLGNNWIKNSSEDAKKLWATYIQSVINYSSVSEPPVDHIESLATCIWSLSRAMKSCDADILPNESQANWLMNAADLDSPAPENIKLKLVGILGLIAQNKNQILANKLIGEWIFGQVKKAAASAGTTNVEVLIEHLNSVYDIYGDNYDYNHPVYVQLKFNAILKANLSSIKTKFKAIDKRSNFALRDHAEECLTNLQNFIKYKDDEAKTLSK